MTQPEQVTPPSADIERERLELERWKQRLDVRLRREELALKRADAARSKWSSPLVLAVIGLFATLVGNIVQNIVQSSANQALERQRFESSLIQKALDTGSPEEAAKRLKFYVALGFVNDESGRIAEYVASPESIPLQPEAGEFGDVFSGQRRSKARLSIGSGPLENFPNLNALLAALPSDTAATPLPSDAGRSAAEQRNVHVRAFIYAATWEISNDIRLVLGPEPQVAEKGYMIAVISGLPSPTSPSFQALKAARDTLKGFMSGTAPGHGYDFYSPPIPVEIDGSLFLNDAHPRGTTGPASLRNGLRTRWEIHPVTRLVFEPTTGR